MNSVALDTAKTMVAVLRNAGFTVNVRETENEFEFVAQNENKETFDASFTFGGLVWHSEYTNRTKKNFTIIRSDICDSETFRNVTTKNMWAKIETAIGRKITTADVLAVKAGA